MFEFAITYLPSTDRARIDQLKAIRDSASYTKEERQQAEADIVEIEKKRKPLHETTYEEANEFRIFLFNKFQKLAQAGANIQAGQFQRFMMMVEAHLRNLQVEAVKKALAEEQHKAEVGKGLRQNDRAKHRRGPVSSSTSAKNPWAIPLDSDD